MEYLEKDELDSLCQKFESVCHENHLTYRLVTKDPISIVIQPDMTMDGQISMLDNAAGYNGKGSFLTFIFVDADVSFKTTGDFVISKQLHNKLLNMSKKIHYMYLWTFFRQELERRKQASGDDDKPFFSMAQEE